MVHTCCMCGKCYNPFLPRTFHSIPKNEERRKIWFNVIGRTIYKTATVCSDHFTESDYHDNIMSKLRRLKSTAIPSSMQHDGIHPVVKIGNSENKEEELEIGQRNENNENNDNSNNNVGHKRILPSKRDMSTRKRVFVETSISNTSSPSLLMAPEPLEEPIRPCSVSNTVCFTETDFCEKEEWTPFVQYLPILTLNTQYLPILNSLNTVVLINTDYNNTQYYNLNADYNNTQYYNLNTDYNNTQYYNMNTDYNNTQYYNLNTYC